MLSILELARACHISKYEVMLVNYETFLFGKQIGPLIDMATKYSASELNEIIYNSSMPSVGPLRMENYQGTECDSSFQGYYDSLYKNYDSFSFCEDCTIMTTVNEGGYLDGFTMNSFLRQEPFMSCNDTFTVSDDVLSLLKEKPPVQLIEQYLRCSPKPIDAAFNAIGIATGWVGLLLPFLLVVALSVISCYYSRVVGELPPTDQDLKEADLENKIEGIIKKCETVKMAADESILRLQSELEDARKLATLLSADVLKMKKDKDEKEKEESGSNVLKSITFGLI